jgi:hypothetical protein
MTRSGVVENGIVASDDGITVLSRGGGDDAVGGVAVKIAG